MKKKCPNCGNVIEFHKERLLVEPLTPEVLECPVCGAAIEKSFRYEYYDERKEGDPQPIGMDGYYKKEIDEKTAEQLGFDSVEEYDEWANGPRWEPD